MFMKPIQLEVPKEWGGGVIKKQKQVLLPGGKPEEASSFVGSDGQSVSKRCKVEKEKTSQNS